MKKRNIFSKLDKAVGGPATSEVQAALVIHQGKSESQVLDEFHRKVDKSGVYGSYPYMIIDEKGQVRPTTRENSAPVTEGKPDQYTIAIEGIWQHVAHGKSPLCLVATLSQSRMNHISEATNGEFTNINQVIEKLQDIRTSDEAKKCDVKTLAK